MTFPSPWNYLRGIQIWFKYLIHFTSWKWYKNSVVPTSGHTHLSMFWFFINNKCIICDTKFCMLFFGVFSLYFWFGHIWFLSQTGQGTSNRKGSLLGTLCLLPPKRPPFQLSSAVNPVRASGTNTNRAVASCQMLTWNAHADSSSRPYEAPPASSSSLSSPPRLWESQFLALSQGLSAFPLTSCRQTGYYLNAGCYCLQGGH